jgi:hypothetical protein
MHSALSRHDEVREQHYEFCIEQQKEMVSALNRIETA